MKKECLNCQAEIIDIPGRRPKKFCGNNCRQKYWQKNKVKKEDPASPTKLTFKSRKLVPVKQDDPLDTTLGDPRDSKARVYNEKGDDLFPMLCDGKKIKKYFADEPLQYFTPINQPIIDKFSQCYPSDYNELLRMAKAGVMDHAAFKKHVEAAKLTGNQKSMIYSKLK